MIEAIGYTITKSLSEMGRVTFLAGSVLKKMFYTRHLYRKTIDQMMLLGIKSIPMTTVTAIFVGMAFTVQVTNEFIKFGAGEMIGGIVGLAIWRELSPLLTGVVVSGRVGAAISAELGTMKVTEQVDALEALSQDPIDYLVVPRVIACTLMMPLLVGFSDIVGFLSGFVVAVTTGHVNPYAYFNSAQNMLTVNDITGGLIKAAVFGFIISILSSYQGLKTKGGAKGVGENTTFAVVISLMAIFVTNYFLSVLLY